MLWHVARRQMWHETRQQQAIHGCNRVTQSQLAITHVKIFCCTFVLLCGMHARCDRKREKGKKKR